MSRRKGPPPLVTPDLIVTNDGVEFIYILWGFRRGDNVVSIGPNHDPEIVAMRLRQAKKDPPCRTISKSVVR